MKNTQSMVKLCESDLSSGKRTDTKAIIKTYALESLLSRCDFTQPLSESEKEWLVNPAVGLEEI